MSTPKVTILVPTYNQEQFIEQCITSLLAQKTNFDYKIIIGEDESSDKTRQICKNFANQYPNKIELILQNRENVIKINGRITGRYNFIDLLNRVNTPYFALCEGDDYWIDEHKLQKQVDFLEQNPDFNICFTRAYLLKNNQLEPHKIPENNLNGIYTYNDLLQYNNFIATASVMVRIDNENFPAKNFPEWFKQIPYGDMGLYLLACKTKKIKCLPDFTAVYRIHSSGVWSGMDKIKQAEASLLFHQLIYPHLTEKQQKTVQQKHKELIKKTALLYSKNRLKKTFKLLQLQKKYKLT
jgi:glycosyltransferase involved in cell wall biosynthesis